MLLGSYISANAQEQVYFNGFEQIQGTDTTMVGYYEIGNIKTGDFVDAHDATSPYAGAYAVHFKNQSPVANTWERPIKFRHLLISDSTSYRVTFYVKGDSKYADTDTTTAATKIQTSLECGTDNHDVPFVAKGNKTFDYSLTGFSPTEYRKFTRMYYYTNHAVEDSYYKTLSWKAAGFENNKFFLTINAYCPGDYYIDNLSIDKAEIADISFNLDVIKIDFGYTTNAATLTKGLPSSTLLLDNNCVAVKVNGSDATIHSVELKSDGSLYVFLEDGYPEDGNADVKVSFTNTTGAKQLNYDGDLFPCSWDDNATKVVKNITDYKASYDDGINQSSVTYHSPIFANSEPVTNSFNLPQTINSFQFTFDKPGYLGGTITGGNEMTDADKPVATLKDASGNIVESLTISPATGMADTIILTRTGNSVLSGKYTVDLTNLKSNKQIDEKEFTDASIVLHYGVKPENDTTGIFFMNNLDIAIDSAKNVIAHSDAKYAGEAMDNLKAAFNNYNGKIFYIVSDYVKGRANLYSAIKAYQSHVTLFDAYPGMKSRAEALLAKYAGTKYANLADYDSLVIKYNKYKDISLSMDNDLNAAIKDLQFYVGRVNTCEGAVQVLTARLNYGLATATKVGINNLAEYTSKVNNAISDDAVLADSINKNIRQTVYAKINSIDFTKDTLDMTSFIKNPDFYAVSNSTWNSSGWDGGVYLRCGWDKVCPDTIMAQDAYEYAWHKSNIVKQSLVGLPVGIYQLSAITNSVELNGKAVNCVLFGAVKDSTYSAPFANDEVWHSQGLSKFNTFVDSIKVEEGDTLTIGYNDKLSSSSIFIGSVKIKMIGKSNTFNYATGIKGVDANDSGLKGVEYYDAAGRRLNSAAKGISITKSIYNDGSVKIRKVTNR